MDRYAISKKVIAKFDVHITIALVEKKTWQKKKFPREMCTFFAVKYIQLSRNLIGRKKKKKRDHFGVRNREIFFYYLRIAALPQNRK